MLSFKSKTNRKENKRSEFSTHAIRNTKSLTMQHQTAIQSRNAISLAMSLWPIDNSTKTSQDVMSLWPTYNSTKRVSKSQKAVAKKNAFASSFADLKTMEYEQIHPRVRKGWRLLFKSNGISKKHRAYPVGEFVRLWIGESFLELLHPFWWLVGESRRFSELKLNCQVGWP